MHKFGKLISLLKKDIYQSVNAHSYSNLMDYIAHNLDISQHAISDDGKGVLLVAGC